VREATYSEDSMAIVTPIKAWYVPQVPVSTLRVQKSPYTQQPWFRALVASIEADGLMSPLIINNREKMVVAVGMNRTRAVRELGWTHVPCIVYGTLPSGVSNATPTFSLEAIQSHIYDGEVYEHHDGGLLLKDYLSPEKMIYPKHKEPYYGSC
jgi:hypothetical protein